MGNVHATKSAILEHWFGVDKVLFGSESPEKLMKEDKYVEYMSTKSAFLSNLFEIYMKLEYQPTREHKSVEELQEFAENSASLAFLETKQMFDTKEVITEVKNNIADTAKLEGLTESEVAQHVVAKNYKAVALDCLTIGKALEEACSVCLNDWDGKIKLEAHKGLRDKLVGFLF